MLSEGHIDIVPMRFGNIHLLDFKLEVVEEKHRWFNCSWIDNKGYFEFWQSDIILGHSVPR